MFDHLYWNGIGAASADISHGIQGVINLKRDRDDAEWLDTFTFRLFELMTSAIAWS